MAINRTTQLRVSNASGSSDDEASSTDRVVNHITNGILTGRYVPGQRLIEPDLTQALQVSRGPVREAFRRLDALGIVATSKYKGACIRTLSRTEAIDLLEAAEGIDSMTARLAASAVKNKKEVRAAAGLQRALQAYVESDTDLTTLPQHRQRFYDLLIAITGNSQLPSLFPTMRLHLLRLQTQAHRNPQDHSRDVEDFSSIARAVLAGEPKAAERAAVAHHRRMRRKVAEMPDEAFPKATLD